MTVSVEGVVSGNGVADMPMTGMAGNPVVNGTTNNNINNNGGAMDMVDLPGVAQAAAGPTTEAAPVDLALHPSGIIPTLQYPHPINII